MERAPRPPATAPDEALVRAVRAGSPLAFAELHRRHRPALMRCAAGILGPHHRALEDVLQDVFQRAHAALRSGRTGSDVALGAWLHRITRNRCIDELRAGRWEGAADALETLAASAEGVEAMDARIALRDTFADIAALPPRQRVALVAVAIEGRSHAQLAHELEASSQACRNLVTRARRELARRRDAREAA